MFNPAIEILQSLRINPNERGNFDSPVIHVYCREIITGSLTHGNSSRKRASARRICDPDPSCIVASRSLALAFAIVFFRSRVPSACGSFESRWAPDERCIAITCACPLRFNIATRYLRRCLSRLGRPAQIPVPRDNAILLLRVSRKR